MTSRDRRRPLVLLALAILWAAPARAQDAADVFDDEPAAKAEPEKKDDKAAEPEKEDEAKVDSKDAAPTPKKDAGADPNVTDRETIEFTHENVAAQMN